MTRLAHGRLLRGAANRYTVATGAGQLLGPFPRLTAWYADAGLTYAYSGVVHQAIPWTPALQRVRAEVEAAAAAAFNSLLLNFYRDGKDSIGFHADAEPELGIPIRSSLRFRWGVRSFIFRQQRDRREKSPIG